MISANATTCSHSKREAILDVALACFLEHGFAGTSMDAVATGASVSKTTLYAYFVGKADLFAAVVERGCNRDLINTSMLPEHGANARSARDTLCQIGRNLLSFLTRPRVLALYRLVVSEASRHPDLARAHWEASTNHALPHLVSVFEELDRRGDLNIPDPVHAAILFGNSIKAEVFVCRLLGLPEGTERMSAEEVVNETVEMTLRCYGGIK